MAARSWTATVSAGRLTLDTPTELPDGPAQLRYVDPSLQCDRLLFVVTRAEGDQLRQAALDRGLSFQDQNHHALGDYHDLGTVGQSRVYAVKTEEGSFGYEGSASRAVHWKNATGARSIVAVGMAFGVDRTTQHLGDVLVVS